METPVLFSTSGYVMHKRSYPGSVCKFSVWYNDLLRVVSIERIDALGRSYDGMSNKNYIDHFNATPFFSNESYVETVFKTYKDREFDAFTKLDFMHVHVNYKSGYSNGVRSKHRTYDFKIGYNKYWLRAIYNSVHHGHDETSRQMQDKFACLLPDGTSFTHPSYRGILAQARKWLDQKGSEPPRFDNTELPANLLGIKQGVFIRNNSA